MGWARRTSGTWATWGQLSDRVSRAMPRALTFVGRDEELAALEAEFEAVRAGEPRIVLVEGPPGIGKTTLVERFVGGPDVLRATGDEEETGVALGILDQLLRQAGRRLRGGDHVAAGAHLLDALGERQPRIVLVDDAQWADAA